MDGTNRIIYQGEPFRAYVEGRGEAIQICQASVFNQAFNFGLSVNIRGYNHDLTFDQVWPRDPIAAWRASKMLPLVGRLSAEVLRDAYQAGMRRSSQQAIARKIGYDNLSYVMKLSVPTEIVRAIIDSQADEFRPDLNLIKEEVRAGTIAWRQFFSHIGIKQPAEDDLKIREQTIKRFSKLFGSVARTSNWTRTGDFRSAMENALLVLIDKGLDKTEPDNVLVALAFIMATLDSVKLAMNNVPDRMPLGRAEYYRALKQRCGREALASTSKWLVSTSARRWFIWYGGKKPLPVKQKLTDERSLNLLKHLSAEFYPGQTGHQ